MIQNRVVYRVGAPVTRTAGDFWPLGIPLNTSWAGYSRTVNINIEDENKNRNGNENDNGNENENDNDCGGGVGDFVNTIAAIAPEGDRVVRKEWPGGRWKLDGIDICDPAVSWECPLAAWNRVDRNGQGGIRFVFPITVFGLSQQAQQIHDYVSPVPIPNDA